MHAGQICTILLILLGSYIDKAKTKIHSKTSSPSKSGARNKATPAILKVAPFPYLPDSTNDQFQSLLDYIKNQFETTYPNINLILRPMNDTDGFYDLPTLTRWLASDGNGYDVVEIDTVLLGDLVNTGIIAPQLVKSDKRSDWHPAAASVVEFNQATYGYPHLLCANVLFTRDEQVAKVRTIDQLVTVLGNVPKTFYRLVGNLDSSWGLPAMWISSYQNSANPSSSDMTAFALHSYQNTSFESVRHLARLCDRIPTENHCLDGTFKKTYDLPARLLAQKQAKAMFGYSERLFFVLKHGTTDDYYNIKMIPLPTGTRQNRAIFTTDAYVFRRNMSSDVLNAARAFAEFMSTPRMQAAIVASGDSPYRNTIPRYLLPISQMAYNEPILASNRFYQEYFRSLTGSSLPTTGFFNTRKDLHATILKSIK